MGLLDKVRASAVENRSPALKCTTCSLLAEMSPDELAEYHEAKNLVGQTVDGIKIVRADIARSIGLRPSAYGEHVTAGHHEPR